MASVSGAFACASLVPTIELPSVDVHVGPALCVPFFVFVASYSVAAGALSTQAYVAAPASAPVPPLPVHV